MNLGPHMNLVENKPIKRFGKHFLYLATSSVLIPCFFYFEMFVVMPTLVDLILWQIFHFSATVFIVFNIIANMVYGMLTDTTIKGRMLQVTEEQGWHACAECETACPPLSRHCDVCNICVLRRDHHCNFLACCIGYFNFRYFYMFVFYIFLGTVYSLLLNVQFVTKVISWNSGFVIVKFIFPIIHFAFDYNNGENICILMIMLNVLIVCFTGFLLAYHTKKLMHVGNMENSMHIERTINYNLEKKAIEVFGKRWYLVWISPFINSQLPNDGINSGKNR